jgi:hypothetical protein
MQPPHLLRVRGRTRHVARHLPLQRLQARRRRRRRLPRLGQALGRGRALLAQAGVALAQQVELLHLLQQLRGLQLRLHGGARALRLHGQLRAGLLRLPACVADETQ